MQAYILFDSIKRLPNHKRALAYVFGRPLLTRRSGWGYRYTRGRLYYAHFLWSKWTDNPNVPSYAQTTNLWAFFSPFNKRYLRTSRWVERLMKQMALKYSAQIHMKCNNPAITDVRAFHRLVFLYANSTDALVVDAARRRILTPKQYYEQNRKYIERPFRLKVTKADLRRI